MRFYRSNHITNASLRAALCTIILAYATCYLGLSTKEHPQDRSTTPPQDEIVRSATENTPSGGRHDARSNETAHYHNDRHTSRAHDTKKEHRSYRDEYQRLAQRFHEATDLHNRTLANHQHAYDQLKAERDASERDWKAVAERSRDQIAVLQKQLQQAYALREEDRKLLEIRRVELEDAQAFLGSADTVSGEEISSMVQALNSDIFQLAASIAESEEFFDDYQCDKDIAVMAGKLFGRELCDLLYGFQNKDHERRELVIQILLQTALLWACTNIVRRCAPNLRYGEIDVACDAITASCPQRTAGRWRAMARSYFKYAKPTEVTTHATRICFYAISLVLHIAGYKAAMIDLEAIQASVAARFDTLERIVNAAIRLDRVMGEEVISQNAELLIARGVAFNPAWMEDAYGEGRDGTVACSLEFGLKLSVRGPELQLASFTVPLKAKVVLLSSLLDRERSSVGA